MGSLYADGSLLRSTIHVIVPSSLLVEPIILERQSLDRGILVPLAVVIQDTELPA